MTNANNNGWTPERRAKQAAAIKKWKPWVQSTSPKSQTGKAAACNNAYKHGGRSREALALRSLLAAHSRWLNEMLAISRTELLEKIACVEKTRQTN